MNDTHHPPQLTVKQCKALLEIGFPNSDGTSDQKVFGELSALGLVEVRGSDGCQTLTERGKLIYAHLTSGPEAQSK
jgi:hypothetical protein